ncbi:protein-L-isoaspartate O-methyltransferase family protein [Alterisphingorhabdus coralli]|uniref:Protein-L-isoaspartate O-methyltransferase n=1 Tax=Alterisphingorhabdus coralli TaxID=3071408 RepID=A0AA97I1P7_9SPHN|nr:rRNA adenine N-6-methyltransferase family protein [Parasphingorhabdus sp. SCSIO 66989]WOE75588.1 rRNA adenine N-6-methyltransferase family protein [Parasphingorhabdus sp. SCSIO 66989]
MFESGTEVMTEIEQAPANVADTEFQTARRAMVNSQLRPNDVNDPVIIGAMAVTPREHFVSEERQASAYIDRAVPLADDRVLNPPLATGRMLTHANIVSSDTVLIIGAGTGYIAALLAPIVESVVALEESDTLFAQLSENVGAIDNVSVQRGPLEKGCPKSAPYSLIVIDGAVETIPAPLARQLSDDGRLLCGQNEAGVTRLAIGRKVGDSISLAHFADNEIAPLSAFARPAEYVF